MLMVGGQRRTDRAAGIAGRRLDPDFGDGAIAQNLAVSDAIKRNATGKAKRDMPVSAASDRAEPQHDFLGHRLDRSGEVHFALGQPHFGLARRAAEERVKTRIGHGQPGAIVEIVEIEPERTVGL